jgi:hypothetical protein
MASTYTTNLGIEKVTTGEKAGLWGTVTNTNLEILEQASSGYIAVDVAAADVTLSLSQGATANGKNLFFKLTGTLAANRQFIMPASAERVYIVQDATVRGASNRTLNVLTASSSNAVPIPPGSTMLVYSDGTDTVLGLLTKGYATITDTNSPYTTVAGAQIFANTTSNPITVTLPASPSTGDEVTIIDTRGTWNSNNLTVGRNGQPINTASSDLTLSTNGQSITLVYIDSTRGWAYKTNTA